MVEANSREAEMSRQLDKMAEMNERNGAELKAQRKTFKTENFEKLDNLIVDKEQNRRSERATAATRVRNNGSENRN